MTCGTNGGYQQHRKAGQEACKPCKDANAAYTREWRSRKGSAQAYARRYALARARAFQKLMEAHPSEFTNLMMQELTFLEWEGVRNGVSEEV